MQARSPATTAYRWPDNARRNVIGEKTESQPLFSTKPQGYGLAACLGFAGATFAVTALLFGLSIGIPFGNAQSTVSSLESQIVSLKAQVVSVDLGEEETCPTAFNNSLTVAPALLTCTPRYASIRTSMETLITCLSDTWWKTPLEANSKFQNFYFVNTGGFNNPLNILIPTAIVGAYLPQGIMNCPGTLAMLIWMNGLVNSMAPHPNVCDPVFQKQFKSHNKVYYWEDTHGLGPDNGPNGGLCTKYVWRYSYFNGISEKMCAPTTCPTDSPTDTQITNYVNQALSGHGNPFAYDPMWTTATAALSSLGAVHMQNAMWQIWNCRNLDNGGNGTHFELMGTYEGKGTKACISPYGKNLSAVPSGTKWSLFSCEVTDHHLGECNLPRSNATMSIEAIRLALWYCQSYDETNNTQMTPYDAIWNTVMGHYMTKPEENNVLSTVLTIGESVQSRKRNDIHSGKN